MSKEPSSYFPNFRLKNATNMVCIKTRLPSTLPSQESEKAKEETKKIEESLKHLPVADRIGSTVSLLCATRLYMLKLSALEVCCISYIKKPKPGQSDDYEYEYIWNGQKSLDQERLNFQDYLLDVQAEGYGSNLLYRALPIILFLLTAAISVKLAMAGVLFSLLIWWAYKFFYCLLPTSAKQKLKSTALDEFSRNPAAQQWASILKNIGPFLTIGLYAIPPIALFMIIGHWLARTTGLEKYLEQQKQKDKSGLVLRQNLQVEDQHDEGFIHSRVFAVTLMAIFASGLPAFFSYYLYCTAGIDAILGYPSRDPQFLKIMFIQLYILSVSSCLSVLFFKAWFTFPLNFLSAEYDIDLTETKIEKQNAKGWFTVCLFWGWQRDLFSSALLWKDVRHVDFFVGNSFRLYPLPPVFFKEQSKVYKLLNRMAAIFDAVSKNKTDGNHLEIVGKHGDIIEIRLNELDSEQKKDVLFYIRKYAPQATISEKAQKALVGSTVLRDPKHTELWFDLLLDKAKREHACFENSNLSLRNGQYNISRKLTSGGQASVYLTNDREGKSFILKEFVLPEGKVQYQLESMVEFENESLILSRLDHPQIVSLKDQFIENCRAYLVIEYVEGKTLRELVRERGALKEAQVLTLAKQMVAILSYLENQNPQVVHRDFTPDNLILQPDGRLKLIDFSISHLYQAGGSADCAGKHSYTPPEQYRGEATPQSDIYAFGATLAFLLTGKDPQPIATSHPKETVPEISQQMDNLVSRATAIPLVERYESCNWIELDLKDATASYA